MNTAGVTKDTVLKYIYLEININPVLQSFQRTPLCVSPPWRCRPRCGWGRWWWHGRAPVGGSSPQTATVPTHRCRGLSVPHAAERAPSSPAPEVSDESLKSPGTTPRDEKLLLQRKERHTWIWQILCVHIQPTQLRLFLPMK